MARIEGYGSIISGLGDISDKTLEAVQRRQQLDIQAQREAALDEYRKSVLNLQTQQEGRRVAKAKHAAELPQSYSPGTVLVWPGGRREQVPFKPHEVTPSEQRAMKKDEYGLAMEGWARSAIAAYGGDYNAANAESMRRFGVNLETLMPKPAVGKATEEPRPSFEQFNIVKSLRDRLGRDASPEEFLTEERRLKALAKEKELPTITPAERSSTLRSNASAVAQSQSLLRTLSGLSPDMDRLEESVGQASFGGKLLPGYMARGAETIGTPAGRAVIKAQAAANQIISTFDRAVLDLKGQRAYRFVERGEATVFSPSLTSAENKRQLASYYHTIAARSRAITEDMLSRADDAESVGAKQQVAPLRRQAADWAAFSKHMFDRMNRVAPPTPTGSVISPGTRKPDFTYNPRTKKLEPVQ